MIRLCACFFAALTVLAQDPQPCSPVLSTPSPNARYCLVLGFQKGKAVRAAGSRFDPGSQSFPAGASAEIEKLLDEELAKLEKPYLTALDPAKPPAGDQPLRDFQGSFGEYFAALAAFCETGESVESVCLRPADITLSEIGVFREFNFYKNRLPLIFDSMADPEQGAVLFRVPPPFDSKRVTFTFPGPSGRPAKREAQLARWLSALDGRLWRNAEVRKRVVEFYEALGLEAFVLPQPEAMSIEIDEARIVRRIVFRTGLPVKGEDSDWTKAGKALYSALPHREFRKFVSRRAAIQTRLDGIPDIPSLEFEQDLGIDLGSAPKFNSLRLPVQQLLLQQVGFALDVSDAGTVAQGDHALRVVDLKLIELSDTAAPKDLPPPAPALTDPQGHVQPHASETRANPSLRPRRPPPADPLPGYCVLGNGVAKTKDRYIGVGGQYAPGQGLRFFGLTQARLPEAFGQSSISMRGGQGGPGEPLLSGSFFSDYFLFDRLHRRLSLQFQGGTDAQANRVLQGAKQDERRTGAMGRAELELFRDLDGHLFKLFSEVRRETVSLSQGASDPVKTNLGALDFGAVHLFESSGTPYPWTLRWEPMVRIAPKFAGNPAGFARGAVSARLHKTLPRGFGIDAAARYEHASGMTPVFELPSLGGAESVRGFRRDDALGSRLWAVQTELWSPLRWPDNEFVRKSLKLATFVDTGNVYGGIAPAEKARVAPGLGLRFLYGPAVIRADWAYGFGRALTGGSRGKFNFSITTNLPI